MSNILQFFGKPYPIGSVINVPYTLNLHSKYTTTDGTEWVPLSQLASFGYTSDYAHLPNNLKTPWSFLPGPESDGTWGPQNPTFGQLNFSIAYRPSPELYVTSAYGFDATSNAAFYYTSTDGSTWTKRNFPTNGVVYNVVEYVAPANKFIAYSPGSGVVTANAIATSTDAITWTAANSNTAIASCYDIVANGTNNIFITPIGTFGAPAIYSVDGGTTWLRTVRSGSTTGGGFSQLGMNGIGGTTWNAGAGLFISWATDRRTYQTSANGQTWTSRTLIISSGLSTRFASNATITVAVGASGATATTTDGINWSNYSFLEGVSPSVPQAPGNLAFPWTVYHDGTRFVVRSPFGIWYSTNGSSWTKSDFSPFSYYFSCVSNGIMFIPSIGRYTGERFKILKVSNVAATTAQTVWIPPVEAIMTELNFRLDALNVYRGQNQVVRIK